MDEPPKYANWKKPEANNYFYDFIYMKYSEIGKTMETESKLLLARAQEEQEGWGVTV